MSDILNPGLGSLSSGHSLDVSLSIINGMLGLSKVGWTYYEGILNRHIWWYLCKNIQMTFWNPFAIHQKLSLANVKFQKIMTNDTYISIYIYIYHHSFTFLTTDFHINFPRLHLRQLGGMLVFLFSVKMARLFLVTKPLGTSGVFRFAKLTSQWQLLWI